MRAMAHGRIRSIRLAVGTMCWVAVCFQHAGAQGYREWTSTTGGKMSAALVKDEGARIHVHRQDGRVLVVRRDRLSEADQDYLDSRPGTAERTARTILQGNPGGDPPTALVRRNAALYRDAVEGLLAVDGQTRKTQAMVFDKLRDTLEGKIRELQTQTGDAEERLKNTVEWSTVPGHDPNASINVALAHARTKNRTEALAAAYRKAIEELPAKQRQDGQRRDIWRNRHRQVLAHRFAVNAKQLSAADGMDEAALMESWEEIKVPAPPPSVLETTGKDPPRPARRRSPPSPRASD